MAFGFSSFRAAVQPLPSPPKEDLDAKNWGIDPVGEFTNVMTRDQLQDHLKQKSLEEAQAILEASGPHIKPAVGTQYDLETRTMTPQPNERVTTQAPQNGYQHPMLTYNLLKGK